MLRRVLIGALLAGVFATPAPAASTVLMPGVTYQKRIEFTAHGPVVIHLITAPKPGGVWGLHPVLSNGVIVGRERVTDMEKDLATTATTAGVNGDLFNWNDAHPSGVLMQNGVLRAQPTPSRSSIGIGADGKLDIRRVSFFGTWQGRGDQHPLSLLNRPPGPNGVSLFTPAWGPTTPATPGAVEAVFAAFPPAVPGRTLVGMITEFDHNGGTPIPAGGAVLMARGSMATRLAAEASVLTSMAVRLTLTPSWDKMVDALGGGPLIVRFGRPVFRAFEDFTYSQTAPRDPRTAVGQRADGTILLVAVDGRQPGYSAGMTNFEFAQLLARLGAVTASSLDTGGSTTMAFDGGLLNRPSDPGGERYVSEALLVFYYGVYAPLPAVPVLSPNGDGIGESQYLSYKVVRPSMVTASIVGPDNVSRYSTTDQRAPGTYGVPWNGTSPDSQPLPEGRWRWVVKAVDDQSRTSSIERGFWLNKTLANLRVPAPFKARRRGRANLARFDLAHPARVSVTIETAKEVVIRRVVQNKSFGIGTRSVGWNGRLAGGQRIYPGRYVLRVTASNQYGPVTMRRVITIRRA